MSSCPSLARLDEYVRGGLAEADRQALESHVERCTRCPDALIDRKIEAALPAQRERHRGTPAEGATRFLGPYRLIREIGRGGQARVYLADDTRQPRRVALKVFPSSFAASPEVSLRLQREASALSRLEHAGICAIHEAGEVSTAAPSSPCSTSRGRRSAKG